MMNRKYSLTTVAAGLRAAVFEADNLEKLQGAVTAVVLVAREIQGFDSGFCLDEFLKACGMGERFVVDQHHMVFYRC